MSKTTRSTSKHPSRSRAPAAKTATIRARIDPALKERAEATFATLGISASEAIALFYAQVVRHGGLPFAVLATPIRAAGPTAWDVLRARVGATTAQKDSPDEPGH